MPRRKINYLEVTVCLDGDMTYYIDDERIEEIARILGGINITESQKNTASELISEGRKLYK
jgi:DNA repair ATPase RecN